MGDTAEPVRFFRELLEAPCSKDPNRNHRDRQAEAEGGDNAESKRETLELEADDEN